MILSLLRVENQLLLTNKVPVQSEPTYQGPVVRKVDKANHRINHYPVDSVVCFVNTYLWDIDLSTG